MPNVQMPDGSVIQFPDSMSEQDINKALAGWKASGAGAPAAGPPPPGQQDTSWSRYPKLLMNALTTGGAMVAGIPGDVSQMTNEGANALGLPPVSMPLPTSNDLLGISNKLGMTNRPEAIPTGAAERYGTAGVEGLIAAAPAIATGGAALPNLLGGVASGLAAQGGKDISPDSKALPIIAGAAGGLGVQGLSSLVAGNNIERIASSLGDSQTMQQAGSAAQDAARNWKTNIMPAKLATVSAPLDAAIPGESPVDLTNFTGVLSSINKKAGDLQPLADVLTESGPRQLQAALAKRNDLSDLVEPGASSGGTTWANARQLRSIIGNAMSNPSIIKSIGQQNLSALYSGITQDLGTTASALGAGDLWQAYNQESSRLYNFASGPLSKLISTENPALETIKPEDAASRLLSAGKKGASDLGALRAEVPDAVDELAAAHLRGAQPWEKLSPEAKAALVPNTHDQQTLDLSVPQKSAPLALTSNALHSGMAGFIGENLVPLIARATLGEHDSSALNELGALIGVATPSVYHGAVNIAKNPGLLRMPATGALAGQIVSGNNALNGQ